MGVLRSSRSYVVVVNAMILLTMTLLLTNANGDGPEAWVIVLLFTPPLLAIMVAIAPLDRKPQFYGLLLSAALMVPAAGLGIFSGWGILYIIGIIFLLFAAWQENEGEE